jgi:hypothetical protein
MKSRIYGHGRLPLEDLDRVLTQSLVARRAASDGRWLAVISMSACDIGECLHWRDCMLSNEHPPHTCLRLVHAA